MARSYDLHISPDIAIESELDDVDGTLCITSHPGDIHEKVSYINEDQAIKLVKHISTLFDIK
ncbi:MAG: hypothetical protein V3T40_01015 [Nitrososphaerales archaeon]